MHPKNTDFTESPCEICSKLIPWRIRNGKPETRTMYESHHTCSDECKSEKQSRSAKKAHDRKKNSRKYGKFNSTGYPLIAWTDSQKLNYNNFMSRL